MLCRLNDNLCLQFKTTVVCAKKMNVAKIFIKIKCASGHVNKKMFIIKIYKMKYIASVFYNLIPFVQKRTLRVYGMTGIISQRYKTVLRLSREQNMKEFLNRSHTTKSHITA